MSTNITEGLNKMKAGPVILLVAIVLHKGLNSAIGDSCKFYRYNGTVLITERPNTYSVKLCSLDINQSTCEVDTEAADCDDHQLNMCKLCDNPSGNNPSMCQIKLCRQSQGPPLLITNPAMNCSITPTESTTEYTITTTITAIQSSLVDTTSTLCRVCSNTHTTTVYISSSVAPTLSMNKNSTTTTQISQTVLGAMLGIFGILLAIVSTGWVCTCWAMKKRRQKKNINTGNIR